MPILDHNPAIYSSYTHVGPLLDTNQIINAKLILAHKMSNTEATNLQQLCKTHNVTISETTDHYVNISGTAANLSTMFSVEFHNFQTVDKQNTYFSHMSDITIHDSINFVTEVLGFNNIPMAKPYFHLAEEVIGNASRDITPNAAPAATLSSFTPLQIAKMYNFPSAYTGKGQVISIIELGGGFVQSDLTHYFTSLGLQKQPIVTAVSVDGAINNPNDPTGANFEVVLDLLVIGSIANESQINVMFAPNTYVGFYDAIYKSINDIRYKSNIVSISWGAAEVYWSKSTLNAYNALFATAVAKGINIFCASGDGNSNDSVGGRSLNVDFPASSPNVIACGGTTLKSSNGTSIISETVWNNNPTTGTGGGFSSLFSKPTYQNNIRAITKKRAIPDICGCADPSTGYQIYISGKTYVIGGTSAVAPLWAALTACLNQAKGSSIGFANPNLYALKPCNDVLVGNNGAYSASIGWDACTGLGSPKGNAILALTTRVVKPNVVSANTNGVINNNTKINANNVNNNNGKHTNNEFNVTIHSANNNVTSNKINNNGFVCIVPKQSPVYPRSKISTHKPIKHDLDCEKTLSISTSCEQVTCKKTKRRQSCSNQSCCKRQ